MSQISTNLPQDRSQPAERQALHLIDPPPALDPIRDRLPLGSEGKVPFKQAILCP